MKVEFRLTKSDYIGMLEDTRTKNERLMAYYEEAGPDYEAWSPNFNMHFGYYERGINPLNREAMLNNMNQKVLDKLNLSALNSGTIADLGCGLGATLRYAKHQYPKLDLKGVTLVPWQVEQAQHLNMDNVNTQNIEIIEADYCRTPFADSSLDGVMAIESSCYAEGKGKSDLLKEVYRVLKPGGRFVIADGFRKHSEPMNKLITTAYDRLCHSWALTELGDINAVEQCLRKLNFQAIEIQDISFKVAPSVAHVPITVLSFLVNELLFGKKSMSKERWDNLKSPLLTMVIGLAQSHFGYYLVSGRK